MKRLVLMRHAKAEHYNAGGDHARELAPRGRSDAANAGLLLAGAGLTHAVVSTAARTRQTFECLGLELSRDDAEWLYYCGSDTLLRRIGETDETVRGLLVIGHAPTIPTLAAHLADASDPQEADQLGSWFPTAAFAEFAFDGTWEALACLSTEVNLVRVER